jgi:ribose 5-phosphate isomerase B
MAANSRPTPLRIAIGSDNAGCLMKTALKAVLEHHAGVVSVLDVGVLSPDDPTAYPHVAVAACDKIVSGEVSVSRVQVKKYPECCPLTTPFH